MKLHPRLLIVSLIFCILFPKIISAQEEYVFDLSEIEKKPYHLGGYVEFRPVVFGLDKDASLYKFGFYNHNEGNTIEEYNLRLHVDGTYEWDKAGLYIKANSYLRKTYQGWSDETKIFEGYVSLKPSLSFTLDLGKCTLKWGKGYAWNPVAFVDRPKNPDDPELGLEGYIMARADYIKSFASGPLNTLAFTPVLIPSERHINEDFGKTRHLNLAGKLYLLLYNTDLDFLFFAGGSKGNAYGIDFSRNIKSNFEVHAEFAYIRDVKNIFIDPNVFSDPNGKGFEKVYNTKSYLIGVRYLTEAETTYILEYYHKGAGFSKKDMRDFYSFLNNAYNQYISSGDDALIKKTSQLNFDRINPMKDYLYLRIAHKEPFDILYFTPAVTIIYNVNDSSFSFSPELLYNPITNLELRIKAGFIYGKNFTEYGEKQNDYKIELRTRYHF
ncbi:MAG: hypothetical protein ACMUIU_00520 [bacterium]